MILRGDFPVLAAVSRNNEAWVLSHGLGVGPWESWWELSGPIKHTRWGWWGRNDGWAGAGSEFLGAQERAQAASTLSGDNWEAVLSCRVLHMDGNVKTEQKAILLTQQCLLNKFAMRSDLAIHTQGLGQCSYCLWLITSIIKSIQQTLGERLNDVLSFFQLKCSWFSMLC